jgi:hypothetical protein
MNTVTKAAANAEPKSLLDLVRRNMGAHYLVMKTRELTKAPSPEAFFGFGPLEVASLHFRKRGAGGGCWYRLRDGRVFDALGKPSQSPRPWYLRKPR